MCGTWNRDRVKLSHINAAFDCVAQQLYESWDHEMWDIFESYFWVGKIWSCLCQTGDAMLKMDPRYDHYTAVSFPGGGNLPSNPPSYPMLLLTVPSRLHLFPFLTKKSIYFRVFWIATKKSNQLKRVLKCK